MSPNFFNLAIILVYLVQVEVALALRPQRGWGYVYDKESGERLRGAVVRLFDMDQGRQVEVQIVDEKGRFGFIAPKNMYLLSAYYPGYKMSGTQDDLLVLPKEQGFFIQINTNESLNNRIALEKA